jgi:MGT family glycosyltransferase
MRRPVIAFFPEASFGAALNCVGIAQELERMGAEPVFLCHPGFGGVFADYGFKEYRLAGDGRPAEATAAETWQTFIRVHLPHFDLSPADQLDAYVAPTWDAIVDSAIAVEAELQDVLARIRPDAVVLDNVILFPAIARAGCPWVRVISCAETELPDPLVPPYLSGLAPEDRDGIAAFRRAYARATDPAHRRYNRLRRAAGLSPLPRGEFLEPSPVLNLLLAPSAVRYPRAVPLPEDLFVFLEGCVRREVAMDIPTLPMNRGPLVYLSFGSLGAIDTGLIGRMIDTFAGIEARFVVNVGAFGEHYDRVPDNVYLGDWFPQPSVVAQSALFIHHGGNNSFCEALYHGVPSLIMPYCWDGHDNAQRAVATGTGRHMHRSDWQPDELRAAIEDLLGDAALRSRLATISARMKADPGTTRAAKAILAAAGVQAGMEADAEASG